MKKEKQYWLLKTEPSAYSIDNLQADRQTPWNGVRNFQARNFIRQMETGDLCLFYHSGDEKSVVGIAKVVTASSPDQTQFDKKDRRYDPKSSPDNPTWFLVDIAFVEKFKRPITLSQIKNNPAFSGMLLTKAMRLSVQPVSEKDFAKMVKLVK